MRVSNYSGCRLGGGRETAAKWSVRRTVNGQNKCLWRTANKGFCAVKKSLERGGSAGVKRRRQRPPLSWEAGEPTGKEEKEEKSARGGEGFFGTWARRHSHSSISFENCFFVTRRQGEKFRTSRRYQKQNDLVLGTLCSTSAARYRQYDPSPQHLSIRSVYLSSLSPFFTTLVILAALEKSGERHHFRVYGKVQMKQKL